MSLGRASPHGISRDTVGWHQVPVDPYLQAHSWICEFQKSEGSYWSLAGTCSGPAPPFPRAVSWGVNLPLCWILPSAAWGTSLGTSFTQSRRVGGRTHWVSQEDSWMSFLGHLLSQVLLQGHTQADSDTFCKLLLKRKDCISLCFC